MYKNILFYLTIFFMIYTQAFSVTRNVSVSNYSFSPTPLNASVGDTIRFTWVAGTHTTTSTTIPPGATTWDSPISSAVPFYNYVITVPGTFNYVCTPHYLSFNMIGVINANLTGIRQIEAVVPKFELKQNFPNPFNPTTTIHFNIPQKSFVTLTIYDITGKEINTMIKSELNEGGYAYDFNGTNLASGIYFYKLQAGNFTDIKRMTLIK